MRLRENRGYCSPIHSFRHLRHEDHPFLIFWIRQPCVSIETYGASRMSQNKRKANPERRRKTVALSVLCVCAVVLVGAMALLWTAPPSKQSAGGRLTSTSNATPPASGSVTNTPDLPPLPDDPVQLVNLGNEMLQRGLLPEATKIYLEALKKNSEDEEVHFNLGFAYARQKMTNEAIHHYEESLRVFPDYAEAHNNLGNLLVGQRKYEEAIEHFTTALKLSPENSSAMNNLGRALAGKGKPAEAIPHLLEAISLNTNYLEAHFNLANVYVATGSNELAEAEFREVLRINPDFAPLVESARARGKRRTP
jgi:Tfp pilus assembly protein PilF